MTVGLDAAWATGASTLAWYAAIENTRATVSPRTTDRDRAPAVTNPPRISGKRERAGARFPAGDCVFQGPSDALAWRRAQPLPRSGGSNIPVRRADRHDPSGVGGRPAGGRLAVEHRPPGRSRKLVCDTRRPMALRVLIVARWYPAHDNPGRGSFVADLVEALRGEGCDVCVASWDYAF